MDVLKKLLHAVGIFLLALLTGYFLWQALFMILLVTPLKGMSLTAGVIVCLGIWIVSLILVLVFYRAHGLSGVVSFCGGAVVLFLLAFFISREALSSRRKTLEKELAELGCNVQMNKLDPVPVMENAALQYDRVLGLMTDIRVPSCFKKLPRNLGNTDFSSAEIETLAIWLGENKDVLAGLEGIENYPRFRYREYREHNFNLVTIPCMNFPKLRKLAKLLCAEIIVGKARNIPQAGRDPQVQLVHIASSLNQEYLLVYQIVARAIASDILSLYVYDMLHSGKSAMPYNVLGKVAAYDFMAAGLQGEMSWIVRFGSRERGPALLRLITSAILEAWMCENMYLARESISILNERSVYYSERADAIVLHRNRLPALPFSIFPVPEWSAQIIREFEYRSRGYLTLILGALVAYREEYGAYPDRLADLEEKGLLPAVPEDIFGGEQYVYRKEEDAMLLYSVGPNGQDDGGVLADRVDIGYNLDIQ